MSSQFSKLDAVSLANAIEIGGITEGIMLSLAREIAMDIAEVPDIIRAHGLSEDQFRELCKNPRFAMLLREETIKWSSALSAGERIRAKAESMVESALPELYAELIKPGLSPAKVELVKTLMKAGGVAQDKDSGNTSEKVNIVINLGAEKKVEFEGVRTIDHNAEEAA